MANSLDIDELEYIPHCDECGAEFIAQADCDELVYSRSTVSSDHYICPDCGTDSVAIYREDEKTYEK